jgi:hypothetical protein
MLRQVRVFLTATKNFQKNCRAAIFCNKRLYFNQDCTKAETSAQFSGGHRFGLVRSQLLFDRGKLFERSVANR